MKRFQRIASIAAVLVTLVTFVPNAGASIKQFQVNTLSGGTLTTGLNDYYKLADPTDYYGANNLTNNGSTPFGSGCVTNAASFNGTSQYLQLASPLSTATNNYSFFMWVNVPTASQKGAFFHNGTQDVDGYSVGVGNNIGNGQDGTGNYLVGAAAGLLWHSYGITIGTGCHLVGVIRNAGVETGYVDGTAGPNTFSDAPATPTGFATVGADSSGRFFNGGIGQFGFWTKALNANEISDLYNTGSGQTMCTVGVDCPGTHRRIMLISMAPFKHEDINMTVKIA